MKKMGPPSGVNRGGVAANPGKTFKRALSYLGRYRNLMGVILALVVVYVACNLGGTYLISPIIEGLTGSSDTITFLWMTFSSKTEFLLAVIGILIGIYVVGVLANLTYQRQIIKVSTGTLYNIRTDLFNHMQLLPIKFFDTNTHGELMSRYTNDVDTMNEFIARGIPQIVSSAFQTILAFVMMLTLSWQLTICAVMLLVCMGLVTTFFGKKAKQNFSVQMRKVGQLNGYLEEHIEGQRVVKAFNHENKVIEEYNRIDEEVRLASTRANSYANMMMPFMGNLTHIFYAIISVVGALLVMSLDSVDARAQYLGVIATFLILLRQFSNPIQQLAMQINSIFLALAGAERIFQVMDTKAELDEGYVTLVNAIIGEDGSLTECKQRTGHWAWKHIHSDNTVTYTELKGDVKFDHVTFGYNEDKTVLRDISLFAKPGQKIAFVGSTGAGKTTITNLINRFYDINGGKIHYDGINISKIKKDDLRRSLSMVLQDTNLFSGTILDNIRYGKLDATDEQCIEACRTANAHHFISHLPDGYNTVISGNGENLSQGQRQLLAIARAAVADPPVLILDEATSSIDTRTEWLIQQGMDRLMSGRTTFVIAHRLSTVRNSDAIMVLENGEIIERGNHDQLIEQQGKYYQLYTGAFELS